MSERNEKIKYFIPQIGKRNMMKANRYRDINQTQLAMQFKTVLMFLSGMLMFQSIIIPVLLFIRFPVSYPLLLL